MLAIEHEFRFSQKILIVMSARVEQFYSFYYALPLSESEYEITVLLQSELSYRISDERFSLLQTAISPICGETLEESIKIQLAEGYDSVVILYNNRDGHGYEAIDRLAMGIKAKNRYVFDIDGSFFAFNEDYLGYKAVEMPKKRRKDLDKALKIADSIQVMPIEGDDNVKPTIIFLTTQGFNLPAARVRCFFLSEELNKLGWQTEVLSTVTHLGYGEEWELSLSDKMAINRHLGELLTSKGKVVIYMQRLDYQAWIVKKLYEEDDIPFIFDYDDWDLQYFPLKELFSDEFSNGEQLLRYFIANSRLNVLSSRYLEQYFSKISPNVLYLPTGVYRANFISQKSGSREVQPGKRVVISWLGTVMRLSNMRDLIFTIQAFNKLSPNYPEAVLEILASGRYLKRVKGFSQGNERIIFKGWCKPDEVVDYLRTVDIGLLPLVDRSPFNQSKSPTKLFEYMYLGRAVLASEVGEACAVVKDSINGMLFRDEEEFAVKLGQLIEQPQLRASMGRAAQATIEAEYTLDQLASNLAKKLDEVL